MTVLRGVGGYGGDGAPAQCAKIETYAPAPAIREL